MSDFERFLASEFKPTVDTEDLKSMAKKAAAKFLKKEASLNDAIKGMVKEAGLNDEQVRRVVEMANTETFVNLFKQGFENNVDFDVADFNEIYEPPKEKEASSRWESPKSYIPGQEYVSLEEVFSTETEKTASADPYEKFFSVRDKVKTAGSELDTTANELELAANSVRAEFTNTVNREEASLEEAVLLLKSAGLEDKVISVLIDEKVSISPLPLDVEPNTEHPLYKVASEFVQAQSKFFGTVDMASGLVKECEAFDHPGLQDLINKSLGKFIKVK